MPRAKIEINIPGEKPYDMRIASGILDSLGEQLRAVPDIESCTKLAVITDSNVSPLYLPRVKKSLIDAGFDVCEITVEAGESSKSVEVIGEVWNALASLGITRDSAVVALGGGVVGDLAGFAASTFMRGIPVVQVPTTLLSMVDSSVGGKTAINLDAGKNLAGTFLQPSYVCASIDVLSTLPEREWACGCAEVAKSASCDSDDFFFWLMDNAQALKVRDTQVIFETLKRCIVFKAGVVARDKTESLGVRECLNYGHTLAHAIESMSGYGHYSHGAAVAEGMRFAAYLGMRVVDTSEEVVEAQKQLLDDLGLTPLDWVSVASEHLETQIKALDIVDCMKRDKKVRHGQLRFTLLSDIGEWSVVNVDDETVLSTLRSFYNLKK